MYSASTGWVGRRYCFEGFWSALFRRGGGLGRLQACSTSRPGACSAEGGLCFDGLGHQQAGSASNSRRAWLATRELCFGLGQPQAGSASKGLYSAAYSRSLVGGRSAQIREGLLPNF